MSCIIKNFTFFYLSCRAQRKDTKLCTPLATFSADSIFLFAKQIIESESGGGEKLA